MHNYKHLLLSLTFAPMFHALAQGPMPQGPGPVTHISLGGKKEMTSTVIPSITVKAGKNFTITLDANHTTGYQWKLPKMNNNLIKFIDTKYEKPRFMVPGKAGKEVWQFKALKPGTTELRFVYHRPWEKTTSVKPTTKTVTVIIK